MSQRVFSGLGSISKLNKLLEEKNSKSILLVSGKRSFSLSGAEKAIQPIINKYNVVNFQDFAVNPKFEDALKGTLIARENKIDTVISIGGGSVIDMAKLVLAFYTPNQKIEC